MNVLLRGSVVACALAITAGTASAVAPATTEGHLVTRHAKEVVDVPLAHTEVHLRVDGMLVDATVTQHFRNPYPDKIEAVYLFPLPTGAAVDDLVIRSGDRTIHGQIQERAQATRTYEAAKGRGEVAALLTQERPNLFTQTIANLEPNATIDVTLHYVQRLAYTSDGYELVFPMVAPPRYTPAAAAPTAAAKADAAAVQPTVLPPSVRSSHDIALDVELDAGLPVTALTSPSHQLVVAREGPARARIAIAPGDTIPNKDFILRYQVAGSAPQLGTLAYRAGAGDGSFLLVAQPPAATAPVAVAPRDVVFVLDTSSSMRGAPLATAKALIRRVLTTLRADDTFQIVRFDDSTSTLGARSPIATKPHNLDVALRWLSGLDAGGATDVTAGLDVALAIPHDPLRLRVVVFISDGFVGDEDAILARATAALGDARLFCFGVGSAVNRYLLEELASLGRGAFQAVRPDEDPTAATAAFVRRIDAPVLTDVRIDWGGLAVRDVSPRAAPDLFLDQPLVLAGHYARAGHGTITVHGTQAGRPVSFDLAVELPEHDAARPAVATVWARQRIAELSRRLVRKADPALEHEILALSLASHVLTRYTAFVAVDDARVTDGKAARRVAVPVEVPDAVQQIGPAASGGVIGGSFGFGMSGAGAGGGGGYGYGYGYGVGAGMLGSIGESHAASGGLAGRAAEPEAVKLGAASVTGELDTAIVRRYLKRSLQKLRYCYEKALLATPALHGALTLHFVIGADGKTTEVTAAGVDEGVATCMADVVKTLEFPKPKGGGVVQVSYPLELVKETP